MNSKVKDANMARLLFRADSVYQSSITLLPPLAGRSRSSALCNWITSPSCYSIQRYDSVFSYITTPFDAVVLSSNLPASHIVFFRFSILACSTLKAARKCDVPAFQTSLDFWMPLSILINICFRCCKFDSVAKPVNSDQISAQTVVRRLRWTQLLAGGTESHICVQFVLSNIPVF